MNTHQHIYSTPIHINTSLHINTSKSQKKAKLRHSHSLTHTHTHTHTQQQQKTKAVIKWLWFSFPGSTPKKKLSLALKMYGVFPSQVLGVQKQTYILGSGKKKHKFEMHARLFNRKTFEYGETRPLPVVWKIGNFHPDLNPPKTSTTLHPKKRPPPHTPLRKTPSRTPKNVKKFRFSQLPKTSKKNFGWVCVRGRRLVVTLPQTIHHTHTTTLLPPTNGGEWEFSCILCDGEKNISCDGKKTFQQVRFFFPSKKCMFMLVFSLTWRGIAIDVHRKPPGHPNYKWFVYKKKIFRYFSCKSARS